MKRILITGAAGFIGSHLAEALKDSGAHLVFLDALNYAGHPENLQAFSDLLTIVPRFGEDLAVVDHTGRVQSLGVPLDADKLPADAREAADPEEFSRLLAQAEAEGRPVLVVANLVNRPVAQQVMARVDQVVHLAAETHVDRSIVHPQRFLASDIWGTYTLLEAARRHPVERFLYVSTDEVYGEVPEGAAAETWPLRPSSPYAASKAAADRLAFAYHRAYRVPVIIARPSNAFGPRQYPEKLIPVMTLLALAHQPLPLYGDGRQRRNWIYVRDLARALVLLLERGEPGTEYNVPGTREIANLDLVRKILDLLGRPHSLIRFVKDRPGHDRRYALTGDRIRALGFTPTHDFDQALRETVVWYREHQDWLRLMMARDAFLREWYRERGLEV